MNKRHCDKCDTILDAKEDNLVMVKTGELCVQANIERYQGGWVPTSDYCRECLGNLMFAYSQWLLRKG